MDSAMLLLTSKKSYYYIVRMFRQLVQYDDERVKRHSWIHHIIYINFDFGTFRE